jgi:hypothetical protein
MTSDPTFEETPYERTQRKAGHGLHNPDPLLMQRRVLSLHERLKAVEEALSRLTYEPDPEPDPVERGALGEPL